MQGLGVIISSFIGATIGSAITAIITPIALNAAIDRLVKQLTAKGTKKNVLLSNVYELMNTNPLTISEIEMRAETGEPLIKPASVAARSSGFQDFLINPAQLSISPVDKDTKVSVEIIIGSEARKPFRAACPILIPNIPHPLEISMSAKMALSKAARNLSVGIGASALELDDDEFLTSVKGSLILEYCGDISDATSFALSSSGMIEIKIGQGANPSVIWERTPFEHLKDTEKAGKDPGEPRFTPRFFRFRGLEELKGIVHSLRDGSGGVPIGAKIAASSYLEEDIDLLLDAGADFIVVEGAEGGAALAPAITIDSFGLPLRFALPRARAHLMKRKSLEKVSIIASGGLRTPSDILKAMCLGANAVYCGTASILAMLQTQTTKALPFAPIRSLVAQGDKESQKLDVEKASQDLTKFFRSCTQELEMGLRALGKTKIEEVSPMDLTALSKDLALATGTRYAGL